MTTLCLVYYHSPVTRSGEVIGAYLGDDLLWFDTARLAPEVAAFSVAAVTHLDTNGKTDLPGLVFGALLPFAGDADTVGRMLGRRVTARAGRGAALRDAVGVPMPIEIVNFDEFSPSLHAGRGCSVAWSKPITSDIIIDYDASGAAIGLELLTVPRSPAEWWTLPERAEIPTDLFDAVAEWLGARERAR